MPDPVASRPYMPGYGLREANEGTGLLPWAWARERLERSHDYWLATADGAGVPHLMPVWGAWMSQALWFSSSLGSRKARNLRARARCTLATDDAQQPVIVQGDSELISDLETIGRFVAAVNRKYGTDYGLDFFAPADNACYRVRPDWAFGLMESDFTGSPTRWIFSPER